jgi:long-chain acyl-CoA synthetase
MEDNTEALEKELTFTRFDRMSERYPDKTAVVYLGERFSYSRLQNLSERFAGALIDLGVKKGDRVIIYIPNCIQWVIAFLGIQKMGAVIVPVSPIYTSFELEYMIKDSGAETIICQDTNFCYAKEVFSNTGLKRAIVTNLADLQHTPIKSQIELNPWNDLSYILYTGGTTGFPKGVPGNHIGMTSYVNDVTDDVAGIHLKEGEDVYIAVNPLFHIMALGLFMSLGLNKGNSTLLMPVPQIDAILETIQRYRVSLPFIE